MHLPAIANLAAVARTWSAESQQVSRRNAMLAATECAQRRSERQAVADYLTAKARPAAPASETPAHIAHR